MHYAWITQHHKISLAFYLKYINFSTPNFQKNSTFGVLSRGLNYNFRLNHNFLKNFTKNTCKNLESHILFFIKINIDVIVLIINIGKVIIGKYLLVKLLNIMLFLNEIMDNIKIIIPIILVIYSFLIFMWSVIFSDI